MTRRGAGMAAALLGVILAWSGASAAEVPTVAVGEAAKQTRVPPALRRGTFIAPQAVSAVDVAEGGRSVAVGTMAFRHDRNFFVLAAEDGNITWGRNVAPWAMQQVAALGEGEGAAYAAGMAFARQTEPAPVVSLFRHGLEKESAGLEAVGWDRRLLRYGEGDDWRSGWTASILGDLLVRTEGAVVAVGSHDATAWQWSVEAAAEGKPRAHPIPRPSAFRMAASADGQVVALGHFLPELAQLDDATRQRLRPVPAGVLTVFDAKGKPLWNAAAMVDAPAVARPPEPGEDFPEMADAFNMKAQAHVPMRVAASVSASGDGSRVAITEYGGWMRVRRERLIGFWSGHGQGISFCPRGQRGTLRIFGAEGKPVAQAQLPREGLFDVRLDAVGEFAWCSPASWFSRGAAGHAWLPADGEAGHTVFVYDIAGQKWALAMRFPDAVADVAVQPGGQRALVSCWDGRAYLVGRDGPMHANVELGGPARLQWSADGAFAIAGTAEGDVVRIERNGTVRWKTTIPAAAAPRLDKPLKPVFEELPIYSVGRVGPEHAYVGDTWLIKTAEGGILVDAGGTSAVPLTVERIRAAGVDPADVRFILLTHSHGDHANAAFLWRARGAEVVAPASAAFGTAWMNTQWTGYGLSVPIPIDRPFPLRKPGDEAELTLCGVKVRAIFAPGHSVDSVVYFMELNGRRVIFTGDIAFDDGRAGMPLGSNILHRCWADREKAAGVVRVIEEKVLPLKPEFEFKGHASNRDPAGSWGRILEATRKAMTPEK